MSSGTSPARHPVETQPGVLVHPAADRRLATEHWLLSTRPDPRQARLEWAEHGAALIPLGTLLSAVRIPAGLVRALVGSEDFAEADVFLEEALDGPVICDPRFGAYYALVPAGVPTTWRQAAQDWRRDDVEVLGRGAYLGVPRLTCTKFHSHTAGYWSVPMSSPAMLCAPLAVARLIAAGAHQLAELEAGAEREAAPAERS